MTRIEELKVEGRVSEKKVKKMFHKVPLLLNPKIFLSQIVYSLFWLIGYHSVPPSLSIDLVETMSQPHPHHWSTYQARKRGQKSMEPTIAITPRENACYFWR